MKIRVISLSWFALFFVLASPLLYGQKETVPTYDGHWWLSVAPREQYGFLNGYADCYIYEYKGPANYSAGAPAIWQRQITDLYNQHPDEQRTPVADVLYQFRAKSSEKPASGGERVKGKHGFYTGLYWMQEYALGNVAEERGFVEGYLWCHAHLSKNQGGVFSKSPDEYVTLITQWYQFDPKTGDVNAERQPDKIADVLYKFRDGATTTEQK